MKPIFRATLAATLIAASLAGCVVEQPRPHRPPPPPVEVVPVMPAPGLHWVPGHYREGERDWIWVPGHWRER
ncbi:MAG: YXWGXW repeat-containing protein [Janthinobacterium lividum]|jgi:hypothetical protein|uniref:hypothetical protein n=1 Tax=Pseudomonas TaxID=286 RepID=UPI001CF9B502|nr:MULTISPECIES: hypothetical protein [Pseudomonas]